MADQAKPSKNSGIWGLRGARPEGLGPVLERHHASLRGDGARFESVRVVGRGSQGTVMAVRDRDCNRTVAFKILHQDRAQPEDISRFIHEAQVTAQLEHPGVIPIHDVGVLPDGTVYYAMKMVAGRSLAEILQENIGRRDRHFRMLELFLRVCETMAFAHSRGVVHRDLKPRNIMVGAYGEVMVCDWGLAKVQGLPGEVSTNPPIRTVRSHDPHDPYATLMGSWIGTPAYMSPEQAHGETQRLDGRSDLYALGVILYEILSGHSPYRLGDVQRTIDQVMGGKWKPLDHRTPSALRLITHRCMAHDPDKRYPDVSALAADLRAYMAGQAVSGHQESLFERIRRWQAHNHRTSRAVVLTLGAVFMLSLGIWITTLYNNAVNFVELQRQAGLAELSGNIVTARRLTEQILAIDPGNGPAKASAERYERAANRTIRQRQAQEIAAKAAALVKQAEILARSPQAEDLEQAAAYYQQAVALAPTDQSILTALDRVAAERGRLLSLREANARQSDRQREAHTLRQRSASAASQRQWSGALALLESALLLAPLPEDAATLAKYSAAAQSAEQEEQAQRRLDAATEAQNQRILEAQRLAGLASEFLKNQDLDQAQELITKARGLYPELAWADANRMQEQVAARRAMQAQQHLSSAKNYAKQLGDLQQESRLLQQRIIILQRQLSEGDLEQRPILAKEEAASRQWEEQRSELQRLQLQALHRAESIDPGGKSVRAALAAYFADQAVAAEERGLGAAAEAAAKAAASYDDGTLADLIAGTARVRVPATASPVRLQRLTPDRDRALHANGEIIDILPGTTRSLPKGRWLASSGTTTTAVRLHRGALSTLDLTSVALPPQTALVILPHGGLVGLAMHETTCQEWQQFLNDPVNQRRQAEAARDGRLIHVPRAAFDANEPLWARNGSRGDWQLLLTSGEKIAKNAPIAGISYEDAVTYALWRRKRDGVAWRLPTVYELSSASACGDERPFPWGEAEDATLCLSALTRSGGEPWNKRPDPSNRDRTVHGIHDLAGSVAEFTSDTWQSRNGATLQLLFGGSFLDRLPERFTNNATRQADPRFVATHFGLRLACDPKTP